MGAKWRERLERLEQFRARIGRGAVADAFDVSGLGCLVGAAWWLQPIFGLAALGFALLLAGWVTSD